MNIDSHTFERWLNVVAIRCTEDEDQEGSDLLSLERELETLYLDALRAEARE